MKKIFLFVTLLGLGLFLFIDTINKIGIHTIIESVSQFKLFAFLIFFFVSYINLIIGTFRWKLLINIGNKDVSLFRLSLHFFGGFMMSYLTPATLLSGEPVRIYLLKKENHISVREGSFSVITDKVLEMTTVFFFIFLAIVLAFSKGLIDGDHLLVFLITIIITAILLIAFYWLTITNKGFFRTLFRCFQFHRFTKTKHLEEKIIHMENKIFVFFMHHKRIFIITLLLATLTWFIKIFETYIILYFLGVSVSFTDVLIITYVPLIALLMPIPGGLGLLESGTVAVMSLLGIDPKIAIALVLISRIRDIIFVAIGLIHTSHHGIKDMISSIKQKEIPTS